jgi:hypothetical protein
LFLSSSAPDAGRAQHRKPRRIDSNSFAKAEIRLVNSGGARGTRMLGDPGATNLPPRDLAQAIPRARTINAQTLTTL